MEYHLKVSERPRSAKGSWSPGKIHVVDGDSGKSLCGFVPKGGWYQCDYPFHFLTDRALYANTMICSHCRDSYDEIAKEGKQ